MTNVRYVLGVCIILSAVLAIGGLSIRADGADPNAVAASAPGDGRRSSPFGSIQANRSRMEQTPTPEALVEPSTDGLSVFGPLSIETVELKYLGAKNAAEAFRCLSSVMGKIIPQEGNNTVLVVDTPDNLKRIVTEIRKADRATAGLILESLNLKYLNAKSAAEVFRGLSSPLGKIIVLEGTNTLLVFDTQDHLKRIVGEIQQADRSTAGVAMETVNLKFLDAKNLMAIVSKMVSSYGSVAANESSNSVIVCDTPDNLQRVLGEIRKADRTPPQILVEVVLLDVQLGNDTEIGINWDYLTQQPEHVGYRQNFTAQRLSMVPYTNDPTIDTASAFNTVGTGGEISIITGTVRNVVHLIQTKRCAQIIASPRAMMVSGKSATIKAVQEIPYEEVVDTSQGGTAAMTSTKFKNVGVTLEVTATLTDGNEIFLKVQTEQNVNTSQSLKGVPVVDTRSENTSLLLRDGQIVVMGGLRRQEKTKQTGKIPLMGDLPIVGGLFRNTRNVVNNAELVVLLSPHIYKGEPVPAEVMAKVNQVKNESLMTAPAQVGPAKADDPRPALTE